jgi:hypothetical protein
MEIISYIIGLFFTTGKEVSEQTEEMKPRKKLTLDLWDFYSDWNVSVIDQLHPLYLRESHHGYWNLQKRARW